METYCFLSLSHLPPYVHKIRNGNTSGLTNLHKNLLQTPTCRLSICYLGLSGKQQYQIFSVWLTGLTRNPSTLPPTPCYLWFSTIGNISMDSQHLLEWDCLTHYALLCTYFHWQERRELLVKLMFSVKSFSEQMTWKIFYFSFISTLYVHFMF